MTTSSEGNNEEKRKSLNNPKRDATLSSHRKAVFISFLLVAIITLGLDLIITADPNAITVNLEIIDLGGFSSFFFCLGVFCLFKLDKKVRVFYETQYESQKDTLWNIIILGLMGLGFIGFWFSLRTIGVTIKSGLILQNYQYTTGQIFAVLGFILISNLCFNLAKTFDKLGNTEKGELTGAKSTSELLDTIIQAIIIGLITFIPRYGDSALLNVLGRNNTFLGSIIYIAIIITWVIVLLRLVKFKNEEIRKNLN